MSLWPPVCQLVETSRRLRHHPHSQQHHSWCLNDPHGPHAGPPQARRPLPWGTRTAHQPPPRGISNSKTATQKHTVRKQTTALSVHERTLVCSRSPKQGRRQGCVHPQLQTCASVPPGLTLWARPRRATWTHWGSKYPQRVDGLTDRASWTMKMAASASRGRGLEAEGPVPDTVPITSVTGEGIQCRPCAVPGVTSASIPALAGVPFT